MAEWVRLGGPTALAKDTADPAGSAHVHDFAGDPAKTPKKPQQKRTSAPVSPQVAGCDRHYGSANVCVPTVFPATVKGRTKAATTKARCDWLAANDYGRLKVNGKDDPLRLDPDRDGVACGKGDMRRR